MRRFSLLLSTLMIISLLLAACGGEETSTTVPSTNVPPVTAEATTTMEGTATGGAGDLTTTPAVPVTGENSTSRLSNLLDFTVQDQNGEQVGNVEDMVLDMDNTRISYVVMSTGGFLGIGDKEVLIPWTSLQLQASGDNNAFVLTTDSEMLKNAPDFDVNSMLPGMGQPASDWDTDIRNFWESGGATGGANSSSTQTANTPSTGTGSATEAPMATATTNAGSGTDTGSGTGNGTNGNGTGSGQKLQGVMLASELLGSTITIGNSNSGTGTGAGTGTGTDQGQATLPAATDSTLSTATSDASGSGSGTGTGTGTGNQGPTSATIEDAIVEPDTGDVQYLVLSSLFDDGERWIPVPLNTLRWDETNQSFLFVANANALQNAPFFQEDQFPDTSSSGWDSDFSTFWQNNGGTSSGSGGVTIATATP